MGVKPPLIMYSVSVFAVWDEQKLDFVKLKYGIFICQCHLLVPFGSVDCRLLVKERDKQVEWRDKNQKL